MTTGHRVPREPVEPPALRPPTGPTPTPAAIDQGAAAPDATPAGEVTLFSLVQVLWRQRVAVVGTALLVTALACTLVLVRPRSYSTTVSFASQSESRESTISGLAAQFGFALPVTGGTTSPQFYVELLRSRTLLRDVVLTTYVVPTDTGAARGNLVTLWRIEGESEPRRVEDAMQALVRAIEATPSAQTGIVRVTVSSMFAVRFAIPSWSRRRR